MEVDKGTLQPIDGYRKRRGITVRASTTSIQWNDTKINIIDNRTHGLSGRGRTHFRCYKVILVVSAKEGIRSNKVVVQCPATTRNTYNSIRQQNRQRGSQSKSALFRDTNSLSKDIIFMQSAEGKDHI